MRSQVRVSQQATSIRVSFRFEQCTLTTLESVIVCVQMLASHTDMVVTMTTQSSLDSLCDVDAAAVRALLVFPACFDLEQALAVTSAVVRFRIDYYPQCPSSCTLSTHAPRLMPPRADCSSCA